MPARSVAVNGTEGPAGMLESTQAGHVLPGKREGLRSGWQPLRSVARAMGAGLLAVLIASAAGAIPAGSAPPLPQYTILNLDTLGPAGSPGMFTPNAINASGTIAGVANGWWNADAHAALFDLTGMHDLGALGPGPIIGNLSGALGLNDNGQVVGCSTGRAFLYSGGAMHDLSVVSGASSIASAINNAGQIVGTSFLGTSSRNILWENGTMTDLGSFRPAAINDAGQVAGSAPAANGQLHAAIWQNGAVTDLGALAGYPYSTATGINATGQVVGGALAGPQQGGHAFFYDGAALHDLGTLGGSYSAAQGINAAGQIVGWAWTKENTAQTQHAFLYNGGVMIDLNDLLPAGSGWVLGRAAAINDAGQILGGGTLNGKWHGFLMTPGIDPRSVPPAAPSGLSVRMVSTSELDLTWTDNSNNENSFEVQVTTSNDGTDWRDVGTVPANTTTFASTGLAVSLDTPYTYRVRAVGVAGASAWSNEATDTFPSPGWA